MRVPATGALARPVPEDAAAQPLSRAQGAYGTLVVFACVLTFLEIMWRGMVRATGAGLACPD